MEHAPRVLLLLFLAALGVLGIAAGVAFYGQWEMHLRLKPDQVQPDTDFVGVLKVD